MNSHLLTCGGAAAHAILMDLSICFFVFSTVRKRQFLRDIIWMFFHCILCFVPTY